MTVQKSVSETPWLAAYFGLAAVLLLLSINARLGEHAKLKAEQNTQVQQAKADQQKKDADGAWSVVESAEQDMPGMGQDYQPYNTALTDAYHRWEALQLAAYGPGWKDLWRQQHMGDTSNCDADESLGMPRSACISAAKDEGDIKPLEPMLYKCRSGGTIMPRDAESCRTNGRLLDADTPEAKAAARATWNTPEGEQILNDAHELDQQHERAREHRREKALKALGLE